MTDTLLLLATLSWPHHSQTVRLIIMIIMTMCGVMTGVQVESSRLPSIPHISLPIPRCISSVSVRSFIKSLCCILIIFISSDKVSSIKASDSASTTSVTGKNYWHCQLVCLCTRPCRQSTVRSRIISYHIISYLLSSQSNISWSHSSGVYLCNDVVTCSRPS